MPNDIGKTRGRILNPPKRNERWRGALALVVVALAVPFLILDTPGTAQGAVPEVVETDRISESLEVVVERVVRPDVAQLAEVATNWSAARSEAEADAEVAELAAFRARVATAVETEFQEDTDFEVLAQAAAKLAAAELAEAAAQEAAAEQAAAAEAAAELAAEEAEAAAQEAAAEQAAAQESAAEDTQPPEPASDPATDNDGPEPPAQVDGRVPPPAGGPSGAQWDQVRNCESTHNYGAINPSGKFRGAYQFSVQTWDWIAGIYYPHLVGIDPAAADPAWQDVMAYALYETSGWGQWPECGRYLR